MVDPGITAPRPGWPEVLVGLTVLAVVAHGTGPVLLTPLGLSPVVHGLAMGALSGVAGIVAFLAAMRLRIRSLGAFGVRGNTIRWILLGIGGGVLAFLLSRVIGVVMYALGIQPENIQATTAPPPGSMPDLIDLEKFFADPEFAVPTISPDGTRIAYLAPTHGRRNIWVRGIDQDHSDAVCVTHDTRRGITTYYWTDDPRWLLYLQDTDGNEDWHLRRVDLDSPDEPAVDLSPMDPGSRVIGVEPYPAVSGSVLVWMNQHP